MSDLRKAAEELMPILDKWKMTYPPCSGADWDKVEALRQALAEGVKQEIKLYDDGVKPKREWVNATHIEIGNLWAQHKEVYGFAMALDALLKEKNN